jgi:hypothetical protein
VFHGVVTNIPTSSTSTMVEQTNKPKEQDPSSSITSSQSTSGQRNGSPSIRIQVNQPTHSSSASPVPVTNVQSPPPTQPMRVPVQTPVAAQQAIQQTLTQLTANPPIRPNVQVIPIQYQAILIKFSIPS